MGRDARKYIKKRKEELPEDWYNAFIAFIEANEFDWPKEHCTTTSPEWTQF